MKFVSLVITILMIAVMLCPVTPAFAMVDSIIFSDDFSAGLDTTNAWTIGGTQSSNLSIGLDTDPGGSSNKCLKLYDSDNTASINITHITGSLSGLVTVEFRMKLGSFGSGENSLGVHIKSGTDANTSSVFSVMVGSGTTTGNKIFGRCRASSTASGNSDIILADNITADNNKWYNIKIVLNLVTDAASYGRVNVYCDDVLKIANYYLRYQNVKSMDRIILSTDQIANGTTAYFDNFSIGTSASFEAEAPSFTITSNSITATSKVVKNKEESSGFKYILAAYDADNRLLAMGTSDQNTQPSLWPTWTSDGTVNNAAGHTECSATVDITNLSPVVKTKVFVWDSLDGLKPIGNAFTNNNQKEVLQTVEALKVQPGGIYSQEIIDDVNSKITNGGEPWVTSYKNLIARAENFKSTTPQPTDNLYIPGIYDDGDASMKAKAGLNDNALKAHCLALAYALNPLSQNTVYADKAVELMNAWARTNKTISTLDDTPLVMAHTGIGLMYAAGLLYNYSGWNPDDRSQFIDWVAGIYKPNVDSILSRTNNWADWGILASLAAANITGDANAIRQNVDLLKQHIDTQIDANGTMPRETQRADRGIWYTYFALAPMTQACELILNSTGENLYQYASPNGKTLKKALDYLFPYAKNPSAWPFGTQTLLPTAKSWPGNLYESMGGAYGDENYTNWVAPYRDVRFKDEQMAGQAWVYATLMRPNRH